VTATRRIRNLKSEWARIAQRYISRLILKRIEAADHAERLDLRISYVSPTGIVVWTAPLASLFRLYPSFANRIPVSLVRMRPKCSCLYLSSIDQMLPRPAKPGKHCWRNRIICCSKKTLLKSQNEKALSAAWKNSVEENNNLYTLTKTIQAQMQELRNETANRTGGNVKGEGRRPQAQNTTQMNWREEVDYAKQKR